MVKKTNIIFLVALACVFIMGSITMISACNLQVSLLNQDPYPATPGDYAKIVFQITGIENPDCGLVNFQLDQNFPISLDPGQSNSLNIQSGTYTSDYSSHAIVPFKVRVDKDALDGNNEITIRYAQNTQGANSTYIVKKFNLDVNNTLTDFNVIIDSFSYATNALTFDVLNIGKHNAQALTVTLPEQDGLKVTGGNEKVIGDLNANDDTTVTFNAVPSVNQIKVNLAYNDLNGNRRTLEKIVPFSSAVYENTKVTSSPKGASYYLLILTWLVLIIVLVYRYFRNKRKKKVEQMRKFK